MTANPGDYPPGPRDCLGSDLCAIWEAIWELVEQGLVEPTHKVVNGQRVFRSAGSDGQVRRRAESTEGIRAYDFRDGETPDDYEPLT